MSIDRPPVSVRCPRCGGPTFRSSHTCFICGDAEPPRVVPPEEVEVKAKTRRLVNTFEACQYCGRIMNKRSLSRHRKLCREARGR